VVKGPSWVAERGRRQEVEDMAGLVINELDEVRARA
jgi:hypothetical protein